jgi:hypothetical protein
MITTIVNEWKILHAKQIGSEFEKYSDYTVQYLVFENLHGDSYLRRWENFRHSAFEDQCATNNYSTEEVTAVTK